MTCTLLNQHNTQLVVQYKSLPCIHRRLRLEPLQWTQLASYNMANNIASDLQKDEYKVIIIGALGVGKTSLLLRYVHNTFEDRISKFISEEKKSVVVNGREIVLHLWDTAGTLSCGLYYSTSNIVRY